MPVEDGGTVRVTYQAEIKEYIANANKAEKKTKSFSENAQGMVKKLGGVYTAVMGTAVALAVTKAVVSFARFEKRMANVKTLLDETSFASTTLTRGFANMKDGVLDLAAAGNDLGALQQGLFDLVSAGVAADDAIGVLRAATELAQAGDTNAAIAVQAHTAAITSFGKEAGTAQEVSEKFYTAQKFGVTTVEKLALEFNKVGGLGKTLGLTFDEVLASATALTADGAKPTSEAFTQVRAVMNGVILAQNKLASESPEVQRALSLSNVRAVGLVEALRQTRDAVGGNIPKMQQLIGSSEGLQAALALTGTQGKLVAKIQRELGNDAQRTATFNKALATQTETLEIKWKKLTGTMAKWSAQSMEMFGPAMKAIVDLAIAAVNEIGNLGKAWREFLGIAEKGTLKRLQQDLKKNTSALSEMQQLTDKLLKTAKEHGTAKHKGFLLEHGARLKIIDDLKKERAEIQKNIKQFDSLEKVVVKSTAKVDSALVSQPAKEKFKTDWAEVVTFLANDVAGGFTDFFRTIKDGTVSTGQAFAALGKSMVKSIVGALGMILTQKGMAKILEAAAILLNPLDVIGKMQVPGLFAQGGALVAAGGTISGAAEAFLAEGAVVKPKAGGHNVQVAEAGVSEAIIPLNRAGLDRAGLGNKTSIETIEINNHFPGVTKASDARQVSAAAGSMGLQTIKSIDKAKRQKGLRGTTGI